MFDALSTASTLPPTDIYYDCIEYISHDTTPELNMILSWLDSLEQQNQAYHVHCVSDSTPDLMCPTPCNYNTMLIDGVDLLWTTNTTFPVIFDSGASKAISGFKEDFVGEIVSPSIELHLCGMADVMYD